MAAVASLVFAMEALAGSSVGSLRAAALHAGFGERHLWIGAEGRTLPSRLPGDKPCSILDPEGDTPRHIASAFLRLYTFARPRRFHLKRQCAVWLMSAFCVHGR